LLWLLLHLLVLVLLFCWLLFLPHVLLGGQPWLLLMLIRRRCLLLLLLPACAHILCPLQQACSDVG
jgi:hypothetical protein